MNITTKELQDNIFKLIENDWMLITAGDKQKANTMTASFGGFGVFCFKNIAIIYVRPERYTYEFLEKHKTFSLSFFEPEYKQKLTFCGRNSGKNYDKFKECGFTLEYTDNETPVISEARINIECKTMYKQDIEKDCFVDTEAFEKTYSSGGMHRMYVAEILNITTK